MPDYKQNAVSGTEWQRCHTVTVFNPLGQAPKISFQEERVITMGGQNLNQWVAGCEKMFSASEAFPLLDPATNQPTGAVMTHGELYRALYSLYMQTASERDGA